MSWNPLGMLPLHDEDSGSGAAAPVAMAIIAMNVTVFLGEVSLRPDQLQGLIADYATIPEALVHDPLGQASTLVTSMFLHGSWMHLIGNMMFVYIFADNVEELLGSGPFAAFYLLCGIVAMGAQVAIDPHSAVPVLGASGAVSGVLGAYVAAFPHNRVRCVYWLGLFIGVVWVPAGVFLGLWFVMQLLPALSGPAAGGGVAFVAHVGGFAAGMALLRFFPQRREVLEAYQQRTAA